MHNSLKFFRNNVLLTLARQGGGSARSPAAGAAERIFCLGSPIGETRQKILRLQADAKGSLRVGEGDSPPSKKNRSVQSEKATKT